MTAATQASCPRCESIAVDATADELRMPLAAAKAERKMYADRSGCTSLVGLAISVAGLFFFPLLFVGIPIMLLGWIGQAVHSYRGRRDETDHPAATYESERLAATRSTCRECGLAWYPDEYESLYARNHPTQ